MKLNAPRRALMATLAAAAMPRPAAAQLPPARTVSLFTWSRAVEQVREHAAAFSRATGLRVSHQHVPWGNYRSALAARLRPDTPLDVVWMSDSWLAEFAWGGHLAALNENRPLAAIARESIPFCQAAMRDGGRLWGVPYYTDYVTLIINTRMLTEGGITQAPTTWAELAAQCAQLKGMGLSERPLVIPLANDPWLPEMLHAMAFSFGTRFADFATGPAVGEDAQRLAAMLHFLREAAAPDGILSPRALTTSEDTAFQDFADGEHAFALMPSYRLFQLNDPQRSSIAGHVRVGLMPDGEGATGHRTCAWVRFYSMTAAAAADPARRQAATALMSAFGGRDWTGNVTLQRNLLRDLGLPACFSMRDAGMEDMVAFLARETGSAEVLYEQRQRLLPKPVEAPWFAAWITATAPGWISVLAGHMTPQEMIETSRQIWNGLRLARGR